mgnify:CR=1 FL=1
MISLLNWVFFRFLKSIISIGKKFRNQLFIFITDEIRKHNNFTKINEKDGRYYDFFLFENEIQILFYMVQSMGDFSINKNSFQIHNKDFFIT